MIRNWIDNLMFRLGYIPKHRMDGNCLIVNKEKFELLKVQDTIMISCRELVQNGLSWDKYKIAAKETMIHRVAENVVENGEFTEEMPVKDMFYRLTFRLYIAIRKK